LLLPHRAVGPRRGIALAAAVVLHAAALAVAITLPSAPARPADEEPIEVGLMESVPTPADADRALPNEEPVLPGEASSDPGAAEQRADIAKIRARRDSLFPFLTLDLPFLARIERDAAEARSKMVNPLAGAAGRLPPLRLSGAELQAEIDRSWSRRDRWRKFAAVAALVATHDPDRGQTADLLRAYLDQNQLQPFCDGATRDRRFWATLENVADHADFIDFARGFARDHPSSRATTELLFMLDELAQASRDALLLLLATVPGRHLPRTEAANPDAFALAESLRRQYGEWLTPRDLITAQAIRARYAGLRLRLLGTIVETTPDGYRAADAQYLAGAVLDSEGNAAAAERMWRAIRPDPSDSYVTAYTDVRDALDTAPPSHRAVRRALDAEYGRWRVFSYQRLRAFGHRCDTF
jgi:hypothetical protein